MTSSTNNCSFSDDEVSQLASCDDQAEFLYLFNIILSVSVSGRAAQAAGSLSPMSQERFVMLPLLYLGLFWSLPFGVIFRNSLEII